MRYQVTVTFVIVPADGRDMNEEDLKGEIDWVFPWNYELVKWDKIPP